MTDPATERLRYERDRYMKAAKGAGVCMTCAVDAPDYFGCTDCLNTGHSSEYHNELYDTKASLKSAEEALGKLRRDVTEGEIDRAIAAVRTPNIQQAAWVEDRLYVALLVKHILEERVKC